MKRIFVIIILIILVNHAFCQDVKFRTGIFLHQSVGVNIWGPNGGTTSVPDEMANYNYNNGLFGLDACSMDERTWPGNPPTNEWERWHRIFENRDQNADIRPFYDNNKIIVIKSSYESSAIIGLGSSDDTLSPTIKSVYNYKWHWKHILKIMENHPDIFFVIWTNPPLVASATNDFQAGMTNAFCKWAKDTLAKGLDPDYERFPKNVYIFDYYHKVAGPDFKLRDNYAVGLNDSRPNATATQVVAPQFVNEIFDAAIAYEEFFRNLAPPEPMGPPNSSENMTIPVTIKWSKVYQATQYRVQVGQDAAYNTVVLDTAVQMDTVCKLWNLRHDWHYYWHVKAVQGQSKESLWSLSQNFRTAIQEPDIPILDKPDSAANQIELKPVFTWFKTPRADYFKIQVARDKAFNYRVINLDNVTDTLLAASDSLEINMKYYWRVNAVNISGESGWSYVHDFTTIMPMPAVPVLSLPVNGREGFPVDSILMWKKALNAQSYDLQVSKDDTFTTNIVDAKAIKDSSYKLKNVLDYYVQYFWRVRANNLSGKSDWSTVWNFTTKETAPGIPSIITPTDGSVNISTTPTFSWNKMKGNVTYAIQLSKFTNMDTPVKYENITDSAYTPSQPLDVNAKYYWIINAKNSIGEGAWSPIYSFNTYDPSDVRDFSASSINLKATPNPFNNSTIISFELQGKERVNLSIYDYLGNRIATLLAQEMDAGSYALPLEMNIPGLPICRLMVGNNIYMIKLIGME